MTFRRFSQDYYDYYYYVTHTRLAPWFIGLWMGAYIIDARDRKFKINLVKFLFKNLFWSFNYYFSVNQFGYLDIHISRYGNYCFYRKRYHE